MSPTPTPIPAKKNTTSSASRIEVPPPCSTRATQPHLDKPTIRWTPGNLHIASAEAERVLAATSRYFVSGGALVRVVDRDDHGIATEQVNEPTLKGVLSGMSDWERQGRDGSWVRCDPHNSVVQSLLHGQDHPYLPTLSGLARQPFYGADDVTP